MKKSTILWAAAGAVVAAVIATVVLVNVLKPAGVVPPGIAGQQVPAEVRAIDFDKRLDVHCSFREQVGPANESTVFRNCRVVGFTGADTPGGKFSGYFDRWLVLELSDGRMAYIPTNSLQYLETAKVP